MNPTFWRGKRVLLTGHTGFKGAWLCMLLDTFGARVAGYALKPPTNPSLFELARVGELVDSTVGDVRELGALRDRVRRFEPQIVIHMAAQSIVLRSYQDPVETYSTNVMGTVHVLDAVREARLPCSIINVTTDKVYANKGLSRGYRESDELGGRDPYSSSKACSELVGHSYRDSYFPLARWEDHRVGLASARAGNVIGGGDWTPRQLIPDTIAAFLQTRPVVLRHPQSVRPWQHVLDCLAGYLSLAEALDRDPRAYSGDWNFGPAAADSRPVSFVVEALASDWGISKSWIQDEAVHPHEEDVLRLDATKAGALLGGHGRLVIEDAIQWVASWYRGFHNGRDARQLCLEQIRSYLSIDAVVRNEIP